MRYFCCKKCEVLYIPYGDGRTLEHRMSGTRRIERRGVFHVGDQVRTQSGRKGKVKRVAGDLDTCTVLWEDGDEFSIRSSNLLHDEGPFGKDAQRGAHSGESSGG